MSDRRYRPQSLLSAPDASPVLTREEATALAEKLLGMVRSRSEGVIIEHTVRSTATVGSGRVLGSKDDDQLSISFDSKFGSGLPVTIGANQRDDATLRRVVEQATSIATPLPLAADEEPDDPDDPKYHTYDKKEYVPVSLWHDSTVAAMDAAPGEVAGQVLEQVKGADLVASAMVGLTARSALYMYQPGMTAWVRETDCELTVTARAPDGTASGWAGQASRDWSTITPRTVVQAAVDLANKGRKPMALEPGRRTAILGPAAVAQLVRRMAPMFDAFDSDNGKTPFSLHSESGKKNKIGLRVFDPRLTLVSDPADPAGGFAPFFEPNGTGIPGLPNPSITWVEAGVLQHLAYNIYYSLKMGTTACEEPYSVHLKPVPGTHTATIDEMIANCTDGVYVNRFSNVSAVDFKTGTMTGMTRDGCFHIKDGKIDRPVQNYRFIESPFFVFNKVKMIGVPERVPMGQTPPMPREFRDFFAWPPLGQGARWPRVPVIVPPMMVEDFSFTALADAV
jgi:predicted Zn-dependent protease